MTFGLIRTALIALVVSLAACVHRSDAPAMPARSAHASSAVQPAASGTPVFVPPNVELAGAPTLGRADSPLVLVVYSDYQCPYCRTLHDTLLPELKRSYIEKGVLRYVYKEFPLDMHPQAQPASLAAYCAGRQRHYWEMQDALYSASPALSDALYRAAAAQLKLDTAQFDRCRVSAAAQRAVQRDQAEGRRLGVHGTPTLFLGRIEGGVLRIERSASGVPTFDALANEIERLHRTAP